MRKEAITLLCGCAFVCVCGMLEGCSSDSKPTPTPFPNPEHNNGITFITATPSKTPTRMSAPTMTPDYYSTAAAAESIVETKIASTAWANKDIPNDQEGNGIPEKQLGSSVQLMMVPESEEYVSTASGILLYDDNKERLYILTAYHLLFAVDDEPKFNVKDIGVRMPQSVDFTDYHFIFDSGVIAFGGAENTDFALIAIDNEQLLSNLDTSKLYTPDDIIFNFDPSLTASDIWRMSKVTFPGAAKENDFLHIIDDPLDPNNILSECHSESVGPKDCFYVAINTDSGASGAGVVAYSGNTSYIIGFHSFASGETSGTRVIDKEEFNELREILDANLDH